jgi:hypothetical protein
LTRAAAIGGLSGPRWQLSLYRPAVEAWQRIGSWPPRGEAIQSAADQDESW